jgi:hypothetical protein
MIEVGQKLWFVPNRNGRGYPREVTVSKLGRKWITLAEPYEPRINRETLIADGGNYISPGRCYLDKQAYEQDQELQKRWRLIQWRFMHVSSKPDHITDADLADLERILRVECTDRH